MFRLPAGDQRKARDIACTGKGQTIALLRNRMRLLRLLKSGECTSLAEAGRGIGLKLSGSEKRWRKYREQGIAGLLDYPFKGYGGKLTSGQQDLLEEKLHTTSLQSLPLCSENLQDRLRPFGHALGFSAAESKKENCPPNARS
jgi:hypothetical protein